MVRKGYIEQQIEGLAQAMARMLRLGGDGPEAIRRELGASCRELTGLELETLLSMSDETLLGLFAGGDRTRRAANAHVASRLLVERARLDRTVARPALRKALLLAAEGVVLEAALRAPEHRALFEQLRAALPDTDRTPMLRRQLARADEALGAFAKAEDAWYGMEDDRVDGAREERLAFYTRLLDLPDDEIEAGGLTREEIHSAQADATGA